MTACSKFWPRSDAPHPHPHHGLLSVIQSFHSDIKEVVKFDGPSSENCLPPHLFDIFIAVKLRDTFGSAFTEGVYLRTRLHEGQPSSAESKKQSPQDIHHGYAVCGCHCLGISHQKAAAESHGQVLMCPAGLHPDHKLRLCEERDLAQQLRVTSLLML